MNEEKQWECKECGSNQCHETILYADEEEVARSYECLECGEFDYGKE